MFRFMKTKKGFTLTELLLVVALVGIIVCVAIPIYNGFTKTARIRSCSATRIEVKAEAESWCKDNFYNTAYCYTIVSDGESGSFANATGGQLSEGEISLLRDQIHGGEIPYCPSCGTITVTVEPRDNGIAKITVTCDGGNDGDCHKSEN